jgi:hypothetical protein
MECPLVTTLAAIVTFAGAESLEPLAGVVSVIAGGVELVVGGELVLGELVPALGV